MNNEWHKYDMHLYRDSFQNYKVYQIPKAQGMKYIPSKRERADF